uniref:Uncharacterized protein n=1 Tax=Knipowitschia caucasica TaxID=637954 RepID=A0AAV2KT00_KNICA
MGRPFRVLLVFSLMLATNAQVNLHETNHFLFAAPEDNITLPCLNKDVEFRGSVQTGSCIGAHSVHWFKKSEESTAGVLYSRGNSSDQCEKSTDSPTNSCFYNLHIHNEQDEDSLHYAALNVQSSSRRQRVTVQTDCVYSRVHL